MREVTAAARRLPAMNTRGGFTLLEILLVLALMSLIAAVLISVSVNLTDDKPVTPEEVFWKAVSETRKQALLSGRDLRLRFVAKEKNRALVASGLTADQHFPFPGTEGELRIDFLAAQKGGSATLVRSQLVETQTVPYVTFYGDGTCTPFRVQFRTGGPARTLEIDPWTCAQVIASNTGAR